MAAGAKTRAHVGAAWPLNSQKENQSHVPTAASPKSSAQSRSLTVTLLLTD